MKRVEADRSRATRSLVFEDRWHRSFLFLQRARETRVDDGESTYNTRPKLISARDIHVWLEEDRFGI